ncbi:hypothetical protein ZEAMMB73_Zm00001d036862 [Zea mays]|uniref:Uncharacterized protein n=1 Tax=Zea mays TaxID=4577 RepID=A0A1D6LS62_MAIZE|nr:hypothetical protein ZEAMMB73_Zm00001d036862 [Zea mays]
MTKMEGSTGSVQIMSRRLVQPESGSSLDMVPSEPEIVHLTPWDLALFTVGHIQKGILLPKAGTGGAQLVDDLASSFASVLGHFYPLAGCLTASEITNGVVSELADVIFTAMLLLLNYGLTNGAAFWLFLNTWLDINHPSSSDGGGGGSTLSTPSPPASAGQMVPRHLSCANPSRHLPFGKLEDIVVR